VLKSKLVKLVGGLLVGGVALLVVLSACSGTNAGGTTEALATPQAAAARQPTPTSAAAAPSQPTATVVAATPTPTATAAPAPTSPSGSSSTDLLARGKLIFEKTAGGVGCAYCHNLDAKGKGPSGADAPNIRNAEEARVRNALAVVPYMSFVKLTDEEIIAVAAYLRYLNAQP